MAIELPSEVATFLNFVGIPYPDINEDDIRELADEVRTFARNIQQTSEAATGAVTDMGSVYSGNSYQALLTSWSAMSVSHMETLDNVCHGVATALDITASVITGVKTAVLVELALLAAAFAAALASAWATAGLSLAVNQMAVTAARRLCESMAQYIIGYILGEVVGKAIEPMEQALMDMIDGTAYKAARAALGDPPDAGPKLMVDPDEVQRYARMLDGYADDITQHAKTFSENTSRLNFVTQSSAFEPDSFDSTSGNEPTPDYWPGLRPEHYKPDISSNSNGSSSNPDNSTQDSTSPVETRTPQAAAPPGIGATPGAPGTGHPTGTGSITAPEPQVAASNGTDSPGAAPGPRGQAPFAEAEAHDPSSAQPVAADTESASTAPAGASATQFGPAVAPDSTQTPRIYTAATDSVSDSATPRPHGVDSTAQPFSSTAQQPGASAGGPSRGTQRRRTDRSEPTRKPAPTPWSVPAPEPEATPSPVEVPTVSAAPTTTPPPKVDLPGLAGTEEASEQPDPAEEKPVISVAPDAAKPGKIPDPQ